MNPNPITLLLFRLLNERQINYCVLRNYEELPESTGKSDLDIYVASSSHDAFIRILADVCVKTGAKLVSYKEDRMCPQFAIGAHLYGLQIDTHLGVANHRGVSYLDEDIIINNILDYNGIKVLSPVVDGLMCFLKETLNNKRCKTEYCEKAYQAIKGMVREDVEKCLKAFSPAVRSMIYDTLKNKDFSEDSIRRLGIIASKDLMTVSAKIKYTFTQMLKLKRFVRPLGYTIAFLGTDGSGKSTIIDRISPILNHAFHKGVRYEHMRPNYLPSLAVLTGKKSKNAPHEVCTDPHGGKASGFMGSLLRISYYWLDYTYGYFRKVYFDKSVKNHVWIFDRYFYDYVNDPLRACIRLPKWLLKCYGLFVPNPDIVICLGARPEQIHERKPELPIEEVRHQVDTLKAFAERNRHAVWVDTGCSVEESVDQAMIAILDMMSKRFANTKLK